MKSTQAQIGRIFIIRLHDGDHLPDALETFAEQNQIASAFCFLIGGARENSRVVVGPQDGNAFPTQAMTTLLSGVHEACGIGTIFQNEAGKPKLHMHAAFGREQKAITGCVRLGVDVWQIAEVIMMELADCSAKRALDKKTGFEILEVS
jgi:predicted DNA-binding protein with PD1-like motif